MLMVSACPTLFRRPLARIFVLQALSCATLSVFCGESYPARAQDLLSNFAESLSPSDGPESGEAVADIQSSSGPSTTLGLGRPSLGIPNYPDAPVYSTRRDKEPTSFRRPEQEDENPTKRLRFTEATSFKVLSASSQPPQSVTKLARTVNLEPAQAPGSRYAQVFETNTPSYAGRAEIAPETLERIYSRNAWVSSRIQAPIAENECATSPFKYCDFKKKFVRYENEQVQSRRDAILQAQSASGSIELMHLRLQGQHNNLKHKLSNKWGQSFSFYEKMQLQARLNAVDHCTRAALHIMRIMNHTFQPTLFENENELLWYEVEAFKDLWALWNEYVYEKVGTRATNTRLSQSNRRPTATEAFGLENKIAKNLSTTPGPSSINALTWLAVEFVLCKLMSPLHAELRGAKRMDHFFKSLIDDVGIADANRWGMPNIEMRITFSKPFILKQNYLGKPPTWLSPAQQDYYRYWASYFKPGQPDIASALALTVRRFSQTD